MPDNSMKIDVKQKNYKPDEEMQLKLGVQKYSDISEVYFREDYNSKSSVGYNEIKIPVLVRLWDGTNLEQPIFVKLLLRSHTAISFFLRMPESFCRKYLPAVDTLITLETKSGELYEAKYLPRHGGLSGGWRRFANDQKLVEGDLAVFHLVEPTRFKVYCIEKGSSAVKLPAHLLNLYEKARQCVPDGSQLIVEERREVRQSRENSNKKVPDKKCSNTFEVKVQFNSIKGLRDFSAVISELLQKDSLPELLLQEYYDLCRAQNAFLHAHLYEGQNPQLFDIISTISETASIGIALRTSTPFSFLDNFTKWSKILTYYEALGMNVSILNSRLHHLHNIALKSDGAVYRSRYIEACSERTKCEYETKKLDLILAKWKKARDLLASEVKVLESKPGRENYMETYFRFIQVKHEVRQVEALITDFGKFFEHYDAIIETLKQKANEHDPQFQEEAGVPWS